MAWGDDSTDGTYKTRVDVQPVCLGQREIDYDSGDGTFPRYRARATAFFNAKVKTTVTTHTGLSQSAAESLATEKNVGSTWKAACITVSVVTVKIPYEKVSQTAQARRVDASGQWAVDVTVTETTLETPAVEGAL